MMTDRKYWYWINNIEGIGNAKLRYLFETFDNPYEIFCAQEKTLQTFGRLTQDDIVNILSDKIRYRNFRQYDELIKTDIKCVFPDEKEYPDKLLHLYDKPFVLYYKGKLPDANRKTVAVVGSRKCSFYGQSVAEEIGRILAQNGVNVVSGLALGTDCYAHKGAVMAGGNTYGVMAGGPEKCYPAQNYNLYMDILKNGGVMSEYRPNTKTVPGMFPIRNRIISGLSDAVIVVEAGRKSGSLITANYALEQNRQILAVPGRIGENTSDGCNELISQGAEIITSYENMLDILGIKLHNVGINNNLVLATNEKMLYSLLLDFTPKSLQTVTSESGLDESSVFTGLLELELKGLIREVSKNFYIRTG